MNSRQIAREWNGEMSGMGYRLSVHRGRTSADRLGPEAFSTGRVLTCGTALLTSAGGFAGRIFHTVQ